MNSEKIGLFIAQLRKQKNMTQKELAKKIGVTDKAISRWETGRGYPDIEFLPDLSKELSVSLNELLNGEFQTESQPVIVPNANLEYVCYAAKINKKKQKKRWITGVSVFIAFVILYSGIIIADRIRFDMEYFSGSDNCVVQPDYSYIMYYDKKYIPLDTGYLGKCQPSEKGAYDCELADKAVDVAKIEGYSPVARILFGEDKIYYVKGIPNDDIIYLYTDYDNLKTQYYVKEEKSEYYSEILSKAEPEKYSAQIVQKDTHTKNIPVSDNVVKALKEAEKGKKDLSVDTAINRSLGEESIRVYAYEANNIFYQNQGELLYKNSKYYWYPYNGLPNYSSSPYVIDNVYYEELEKVFSYMFK